MSELRRDELRELILWTVAEHGYTLPRARSYSKPDLERMALEVFEDDELPEELEPFDPEDEEDKARVSSTAFSASSSERSRSSALIANSDAAPDVPPGTLLAESYRVVRKLGEGGFGAAYEVESQLPRRTLVAKLAADDKRNSLVNEYEKIRLVDHPNVCRVYDLALDRRWGPFLVVQHGGRALAGIARQGIPARDAVRIASLAAKGLDHLHELGIVHGDVNPGNVLVDEQAVVRLADFGLSSFLTRAATSAGVSREATTVRGHHREFSATEVLRGRPASARSDQSSLALVFLWMLVGDGPFAFDQHAGLAGAPAGVRAAIDRALHPDPASRFGSCAAFLNDLASGAR